MTERIFIVHPETKELTCVESVTFSEIGIKERQDLEEWIIKYPTMLGEELLVVTSEFDRFDKSNRRLDVMALDKTGKLVIIELKLEVKHTLADLQAVRYAAFCSTMTMDQVVDILKDWNQSSKEEAEQTILDFIQLPELPELDNQPRIILVSSDMNDQELTSTLLWLRSFGVDISCIELTPYRLPEHDKLILVPKIIIPLPEAKEYLVNVERKQIVQAQAKKESEYSKFWKQVIEKYNSLQTTLPPAQFVAKGSYLWLYSGSLSRYHYEFCLRKRLSRMDVAIHFETSDKETNMKNLAFIEGMRAVITKDIKYEFICEERGKKWASAAFVLPYRKTFESSMFIDEMVNTMIPLIDRTHQALEKNQT